MAPLRNSYIRSGRDRVSPSSNTPIAVATSDIFDKTSDPHFFESASDAGYSSSRASTLTTSSTSSRNTSARQESVFDSITIKQQVLKPTIGLDRLFYWLAERHAMYERRARGEPCPWTRDPVLSSHRFCNAYRVLDRTTQFLIRDVIEGPGQLQTHTEIIFRVVLFSLFTKIDTWRELKKAFGGNLTWKHFDAKAYLEVLDNVSEQGISLFTGAFQVPCVPGTKTHAFAIQILLPKIMSTLPDAIRSAKFMADIYCHILTYPTFADFRAYQLVLNLSYSSVMHFSPRDFVIPGVGAESGLKKLFGESYKKATDVVPFIGIDIIRWLVEHQRECFDKLDLSWDGLKGPDGRFWELQLEDMEHAICELDKFSRKDPLSRHLKGTSKALGIKHRYEPESLSSTELEPVVIPKAWSNAKRKPLRIGCAAIDGNRYTVDRIVRHRGDGNQREYEVGWLYWPESEMTWEKAADVPEKWVQDYERRWVAAGCPEPIPDPLVKQPVRVKATHACLRCNRQKIKCESRTMTTPCKACQRAGQECLARSEATKPKGKRPVFNDILNQESRDFNGLRNLK